MFHIRFVRTPTNTDSFHLAGGAEYPLPRYKGLTNSQECNWPLRSGVWKLLRSLERPDLV